MTNAQKLVDNITERPVIILAPQRVGGSIITRFLADASKFPTAEHEPFQPNREFSYVLHDFSKSKNNAVMQKQIKEIIDKRINIKHCWPISLKEINTELLYAASKNDYTFIMLERNNEKNRQLSRLIAKSTHIWGQDRHRYLKQYNKILNGEIVPDAINLQHLLDNIQSFYDKKQSLLDALSENNIEHHTVAYENFFIGDNSINANARTLALKLGMSVEKIDHSLKVFSEYEPLYDTSKLSKFIPNFSKARKILEDIFDGET